MYQVCFKQQLQNIQMKAKLYQSRLQQQLTSNYNICQMIIEREGVNAGKPLIKYQQFMYLILNGRIPISKIAYFRNKKYTDQQPLLRRTFLVQDGIKISMEVVEKAWRFQRSPEKISPDLQKVTNDPEKQIITHHSTMNIRQVKQTIENQNKQQVDHENSEKVQREQPKRQIKSLEKQDKSKKDQKFNKRIRIEQLKQTLALVQSKINSTKYEEQLLTHQKQYNKYFKQLQYLRNQKRIQKQKRLLKKIEEDNNKSSSIMKKLSELLDKMNKIKAGNAKILDKLPSFEQRISKTEQINRISAIFNHYARKQVGNSQKYFADRQKQISHLNLQIFLKFVQDWQLNRILSLDKITNIFKIRSKGKKSVNIFQFNQILNDTHVHQCIAEQKSFTNDSNSQYIQEYIVNEVKMNKILLNRSNSKTEPLKAVSHQQRQQIQNKKISNYKFKPKPYSGKYIHDIKQELMSKRQMIDFLAGPKNAIKYHNKNSLNLRSNTVENSKIEMGTIETSMYHPTNSGNDSINNSYAFQFKLKRNKKRYKTEDVQGQAKQVEENVDLYEQNRKYINNRGQSQNISQETQNSKKNTISSELLRDNSQQERAIDNLLANLKGDKYNVNSFVKNEELEDLINESEEDQYLKKFILPPIKQKRSHKYVHY